MIRQGSGVLRSVCLCVCVCVCLSASISLEPLDRPMQNFYVDYLWPWLGPPLAALRYVVYFRFLHDDDIFGRSGPYGHAWLAALRYRGGVYDYECLVFGL